MIRLRFVFRAVLITIGSMISVIAAGQYHFENDMFKLTIPQEYEVLSEDIVDGLNSEMKKKKHLEFFLALYSPKNETVITFQLIEVKKNIKSLKAFEQLLFSEKIQQIVKNSGRRIIDKGFLINERAFYNQIVDRDKAHALTVNFLNKAGFLAVKVNGTEHQSVDDYIDIMTGITWNEEFDGFPSYSFVQDLDWTAILLRGFTGAINSATPRIKK